MNTLSKFLFILLLVAGTVAGSKKSTEPCKLEEPNYSQNIKTLNKAAEEITEAGKDKKLQYSKLPNLHFTMKKVINIVECMTGIGDARTLLLAEIYHVNNGIGELIDSTSSAPAARLALIPSLRKKATDLEKSLAKFHPLRINASDSKTTRDLKSSVKKIVDAWNKALSNWGTK